MEIMKYEEVKSIVDRNADRIVAAAIQKYGDPEENRYCDAEFIFADRDGTKYYCLVNIPWHASMGDACCILADGQSGAELKPGEEPEIEGADFAMMSYADALDMVCGGDDEPKAIDLTVPDPAFEPWDPLA